MKKLFITFFVVLIILVSTNFTCGFNEKNNLSTINYLIQYTDNKINDISLVQKKYNLETNKKISNKIKELKDIKLFLIKIKNTGKYNNYTGKIVEQLKQNNNILKNYIKKKINQKKEEAQKYTILYSMRIKPIINKLDNIAINIASKLMQKEKLNTKDKQIINLLYQIKNKIKKLDNLTSKKFNTKKELQNYIIGNFNQIKFNFIQIKNIVKPK